MGEPGARTGCHRGPDALRRNGREGRGPVPRAQGAAGDRALRAAAPRGAAAHPLRAAGTVTASARRTPRRCCP
ncbi:DUF3151 family protein [Streptomyces sp. NPDC016640]|uniref:DUF3151 family protein n=1 Tax=Streptomyces sp. NPDC016640 TaxID=3364969 RepID=UPI0036F7BB07